jgi:demethylmenaquinone methyltransferase/2-methoxy-6-polyprenyl-1,4-benzoquinol methylase
MIRPFRDGAFSARAPEGLLLARRYGDQALTRSEFTTPEEVNEVYGRRARFFDWSVNAYYLLGFRWWVYRRRAIAALELQPGATIVEIGCGTGLNFRLLQESIGLSGRLIGVDLSTDMLEQARQRIAANGWSNVELVQARAADYDFPSSVDAVLSTFALSLEPRFDEVIAKAAMTLVGDGRFVLLDLRMPDNWLRNLAPVLVWLVRPFAVSLEVAKRQPWKSLQRYFPQYSYQEGYLGLVYIAIGRQKRAPGVR